MRKQIVVFAVLVGLFAASVSAQTTILPEHFGSWVADGPAKSLRVQDLGNNWVQGTDGNKVLAEAVVKRIEQRSYRNGDDQATFRVFTLQDPSSAYEFYTFLLAQGMRNMGVGEDSALSQYDGRILIGNLVAQVTLSPNVKPESVNDLLAPLRSNADLTPYPPLRNYLPQTWRVFGTEKYALGPQAFRSGMASLNQGAYAANLSSEIGFQDGAEAIMARYQGEHGSGVLLLIEYPTPQLAENHLHHLEQALPASAKKAGVSVERKASMLSLVFAATSPMHAQAIRNEVNYSTEVTWNEPSQTATDPPLVYMMFKIFLFTSLFLILATIAGIAFGGIRVLIKHWLPGKVFDRPQDIEVLQLGLSGKKIDPTDLY
jgi:hypothetical protein